MKNYDDNFIRDLLSDYRSDQEQDALDEEYDTYREVCALNGWAEDDYTFDDYLRDYAHTRSFTGSITW